MIDFNLAFQPKYAENPDTGDEFQIAHVSFEGNSVAIIACWEDDVWTYRATDGDTDFTILGWEDGSEEPLTMGEMVALLGDVEYADSGQSGLLLPFLEECEEYDRELSECAEAHTVTSDFYPQLGAYCHHVMELAVAERELERAEEQAQEKRQARSRLLGLPNPLTYDELEKTVKAYQDAEKAARADLALADSATQKPVGG